MFSRGISFVKKVILPTIISTGRLVSTIGESLFILPKFIKYVTGQNEHAANFYASLGAIGINTLINVSTRIPAIFHHFRSIPKDIPKPGEDNQLPYVDVKEKEEKIDVECNHCEMNFGYKGTSIYLTLKVLNFASLGFTFVGSYLNAVTFIEFITKYGFNTDAHEDKLEYITQSAAITLAVCGSATYAIYTLKKANKNARLLAQMIDNKHFTLDSCSLSTLALSVLGASTVPFLAFFSTSNAINKLPWIVVPAPLTKGLAGLSSITRTLTTLQTQTPALYSVLKTEKNKIKYLTTLAWEKPLKGLTYFAGIGELTLNTVSDFTAFVNTSHDVFGIDPKNKWLIAAASGSALLHSTLGFFFSVHEGIKHTIDNYRENEFHYTSVAQEESFANETFLIEDDAEDLDAIELQEYQSILLFQPKKHMYVDYDETLAIKNKFTNSY